VDLLATPRLRLRQWRDDDVAAFFDIYSRDEVARWLGPQPRRAVATLGEAATRLSRWREYGETLASPYGLWAIVPADSDNDQPIGTALLLPLRDDEGPTGDVEVGWHLHPDQHGKGFATEAATALLAAAAEAGITEVLALTDVDNVASQAVAARLDMIDDGVTDRWFGLTTRQFRKPL
jgi:RimJ/RimL family protein N-acetyltransferase